MTEKRFKEIIDAILTIGVSGKELAELQAAITFEPEPVRYFQRRVEVPEPCREALKRGQKYYKPTFYKGEPSFSKLEWDNEETDSAYLAADLVYLTPDHAIARAAAWFEIEVGSDTKGF
jgi:hypothetical protein